MTTRTGCIRNVPGRTCAASHRSRPEQARRADESGSTTAATGNANAALYQIVLTRMSSDPETRNYVRRRRAEGLSTREIMRCLKRYVARQTFKHLPRAA